MNGFAPRYGILDEDGNVLPATMEEWGRFFERNKGQRIIEQDYLAGDIKVSTVFLGLDHNYLSSGPPLYFETMVFGPERIEWNPILKRDNPTRDDHYCERTTTLKQAKEAHLEAIEWVKGQSWYIGGRIPS